MISLILLGVFTLIAIIVGIARRKAFINLDISGMAIPIGILVTGILISLFQPFKAERIDSGNVGVRVNLTGSERGVSDVAFAKGWVIYNVWTEQLFEFPEYQQHIEYDDQQVILKGGFTTVIRPTFNYSLKSDMIPEMFSELRLTIKEIEAGWLKTAIIASVNDVSNRWKVDDIFNHREKFENEILADCNKRVGMWFDVSQLRTNMVPPASIRKSIEAKTNAIQLEQAKVTEVKVVEAEGLKAVAQAKADSAKAVITANGRALAVIIKAEAEAKAIRIKQKEVSAVYNEYIRSKRWDGKYPSTVAGNGSGILLDAR